MFLDFKWSDFKSPLWKHKYCGDPNKAHGGDIYTKLLLLQYSNGKNYNNLNNSSVFRYHLKIRQTWYSELHCVLNVYLLFRLPIQMLAQLDNYTFLRVLFHFVSTKNFKML